MKATKQKKLHVFLIVEISQLRTINKLWRYPKDADPIAESLSYGTMNNKKIKLSCELFYALEM
jgi:hypothetical protein